MQSCATCIEVLTCDIRSCGLIQLSDVVQCGWQKSDWTAAVFEDGSKDARVAEHVAGCAHLSWVGAGTSAGSERGQTVAQCAGEGPKGAAIKSNGCH